MDDRCFEKRALQVTKKTVEGTKDSERELISAVSLEICQYFGFHDQTIGESFYQALKRGDFRFIQLKNSDLGGEDGD
ncbi:hypothetical protein [Enterobacter mori]|uniref:hypothetical protein n=1 Tax=Enterobacter mori TaxID=539813 RepID=UPI001B8B2E6B|nr:hypothetical protein [Enterobacter mori]MBS3048122.1 hypothetical protein [Enterobacter mori]